MAAKPTSQFSLPLPSWLQAPSVRTAEYERRGKRRRAAEPDSEGEAIDDGDTTDASGIGPQTINLDDEDEVRRSSRTQITLTPNEAHQYRIAGLSPDQPLPQGKFPHMPPKGKHGAKGSFAKSLADTPPSSDPVYAPQSFAYRVDDIHLKHLLMLTTVMHRCLMEGEYTRAARAFGLLIREKYKGFPIDVRYSVRWGIGAEVLLRKGTGAGSSTDEQRKAQPFTRRGFMEAKEYYERMIIQHPFSKMAPPHAISAVHFYPAMFGLWIYVVQEESNTGRQNIMDHYENSSAGSDDEDSERRELFKKNSLVADVRAQELSEAHQIAKRMDTVLSSPPFSDSPHLLEMRGMVSLWIGDLLVSSLRPIDSAGDMEIDYGSEGLRSEALKKRDLEWAKSKELLAKAKERGQGVIRDFGDLHFGSDSMEDNDMDDDLDEEDDVMDDEM